MVEFTAVVWDPDAGRYALRTFAREEPDAKAFLVHVGRAFLTDVTLRAGALSMMRCQSYTDIPTSELFAAPGGTGRTFESFIAASGRAEAIWFPFTDKPWFKVWTPTPVKPTSARAVTGPYNYPFSDLIPRPVAKAANRIVRGYEASAPAFGAIQYEVSRNALAATDANDLWGPSKNTQLYIRASTLRVDEIGYAVITRRADAQRALHLLTTAYTALLEEFRARGSYPMNGPVEIRCCGLDDPAAAGIAGPPPVLAASAPRADNPDWDIAVWPNLLTLTGTTDTVEFYRRYEQWMLATFDGTWATLRPEWSKNWAFSTTAACADPEILDSRIPGLVSAGRTDDDDFAWAHARLDAHDPHGVFSNEFLDRWRQD